MKKLIVVTLAAIMLVCGTITVFAATSTTTEVETAEVETAEVETVEIETVEVETANEHEHVLTYAIDKAGHVMSCYVCGYDAGVEEAHTFFNGVCSMCGYKAHKCHISRANENYHRFECDECENYSRVNHDETTMVALVKNEWFHNRSCADCGYEYAEEHDFETESNGTSHWEVCVVCGYTTTEEAHTLVNAFYGNNHDIECDWCGYVAEHHVRTKYATVDEYGCTATCGCGTVEVVEHGFDGFVCDNCNYVVAGPTYGLVERITEYDDYYRIRLNVEDVTYRVKVTELTVEEGDFVVVEHDGNEIYGVSPLVKFALVNNTEDVDNCVSAHILSVMEYEFINNTVQSVKAEEELISIFFADGNKLNFPHPVVYDFVNTEFTSYEEITMGDRLIWTWIAHSAQDLILIY